VIAARYSVYGFTSPRLLLLRQRLEYRAATDVRSFFEAVLVVATDLDARPRAWLYGNVLRAASDACLGGRQGQAFTL